MDPNQDTALANQLFILENPVALNNRDCAVRFSFRGKS